MNITFDQVKEVAEAFGIEASNGTDTLGQSLAHRWTFTFLGTETRTRIVRLNTQDNVIKDINGDGLQLDGDWVTAIAWVLTGSRLFMTTYLGLRLCETIRSYPALVRAAKAAEVEFRENMMG